MHRCCGNPAACSKDVGLVLVVGVVIVVVVDVVLGKQDVLAAPRIIIP